MSFCDIVGTDVQSIGIFERFFTTMYGSLSAMTGRGTTCYQPIEVVKRLIGHWSQGCDFDRWLSLKPLRLSFCQKGIQFKKMTKILLFKDNKP